MVTALSAEVLPKLLFHCMCPNLNSYDIASYAKSAGSATRYYCSSLEIEKIMSSRGLFSLLELSKVKDTYTACYCKTGKNLGSLVCISWLHHGISECLF